MGAREKQAMRGQEADGFAFAGGMEAVASATQTTEKNQPTILLVEDETGLRLMMHKLIQTFGYRVIPVANGSEALDIWQAHGAEIDLLLTDMCPGSNWRKS